jgi:hypothetical protein|tara:strand:- start:648 stop:866 length:219 start_codon:yes stop_codon:yes gene_type:complete
MNQIHGWYSLEAYLRGEEEHIYINDDNQETLCTIVSKEKGCPYGDTSPYRKDAIYTGELRYFVKSINESRKK